MNKSTVKLFLFVLTTLLLFGCQSTPKIMAIREPNSDLSRYRTFAFHSRLAAKEGGYLSFVTKKLKSAVAVEMQARGYRLSEQPELLINFNIYLRDKIDVATIDYPRYYGYRYGYSTWSGYASQTRVDQYTEGTLNIDIIDKEQQQLLWEGIAIGRLRRRNTENLDARVNQVVKLIFEKYPIQPKG